MKVLFFMNHADKGGAALAYIELIENLHKNYNVECVVYTGKKNLINERCSKQGIENYSAFYRNFISSYHSPRFLWKIILCIRHFAGNYIALKQIERQIDITSFDLIYTNLDRIDIGAIISKKYSIPHIWHIREHLDTDFKVISIYRDYVKYMKSFKSEFIAVSSSVKTAWVNRGFKSDEIRIIYDGVSINTIHKNLQKKDERKLKILFLGGYCKEKGQLDFLNTVSQLDRRVLNRIELSFFGSNLKKKKSNLEQFANKVGIRDIVNFNDYNKDIYFLIKEYDAGINYSIQEGFGRVTVEYMAAGLVPIVTNSGASKEIVENNKSGIVVERNNIEQLNAALITILDSQKRERLSKGAILRASLFSMEIHSENMYTLFNEEFMR